MTDATELQVDRDFERLLDYLRRVRGFDFTGYKRASLARRIDKRMASVHVPGYAEYLDFLEVHPDEFAELFNTVLINVTSFFRDPTIWDYMHDTVVPELLERKGPDQPVRVWSAGCATGAEPYTLAMVLAKAMGVAEFRERVKIYATDVDDDALAEARAASYAERDMRGVTDEVRAEFFEQVGDQWVFSKDLRRSVIFGRHDIIQDAPISRIDLLVCRNALIYFNTETQSKILTRFHFALNTDGFLLLGKAEMLLAHHALFVPVDMRRRIFRKVPVVLGRPQPALELKRAVPVQEDDRASEDRLRELTFETSPVAGVVLDANGKVALVNERASTTYGVLPTDVGRSFHETDLSYRPVELRRHIDDVERERRPTRLKDVEWPRPSGERLFVDIELVPLLDVDASYLGVVMSFTDVTRYHQLQAELEHANLELETAYEELQSTNEELETTNEELQSTVEELETTNEELQSTNEELETMNEELQSTNDELQSINDQLRDRTSDLNSVNTYLQSILGSMENGVIVVDREMRVRVWNRQAEELWGLRPNEVAGQHMLSLDIGLPVEQLAQPLRRAVADGESTELVTAAVNRRGREVRCRVTLMPLSSAAGDIEGAIAITTVPNAE
ncbi:MAG TPA: CheR family methyltransferase [Mycobacteriales bacterium]|nr:CheR family methyltransferase [Mycobacteriales bacterium]